MSGQTVSKPGTTDGSDRETPQDFWLRELGGADRFTAWVFDTISPHLGEQVLEIGCGTGTFTARMAASGRAVTGIDVNPSYVQATRERMAGITSGRVLQGDVVDLKLDADELFDTVVMLDVLEHLQDDVGILRALSAHLAPGGRMVLKVPAMPGLFGSMDSAIGHFRRYSPATMQATLNQAGFRPAKIRYFNAAAVAAWWINGKLLRRATPPAEQVAVFDRLVPLFRMVDRASAGLAGISLIAVAHRVPE